MKQQARCYLFVVFGTWLDSVITELLLQPALTSCEIPFSGLSFPEGPHICVLHIYDAILQLVLEIKMKTKAQSSESCVYGVVVHICVFYLSFFMKTEWKLTNTPFRK